MNLTEFSKEVHQNAMDHGWWEKEVTFGEVIALCHSELSEALQEYRDGMPMEYRRCEFYRHQVSKIACEKEKCSANLTGGCDERYISDKPEGVAVELADCILRILDYCGKEGIDIERILLEKHDYNKGRPYRHGGKRL